MRASCRLGWLRSWSLHGARPQSKTRTSWQAIVKASSAALRAPGRHIYIARTREALTYWGYMQAMQDLSVLADEEGHRIMGACPPEQTTTLQLIQSFIRYARAHRTELQGNAVVAVFRALRGAYPCRAERGD
jgi:Rap1a immunity proteins